MLGPYRRLRLGDPRAFRLFACAAARHVWDRFRDARSRSAIERVEDYAVGQADEADLARAFEEASAAVQDATTALEAAMQARRALGALPNGSSASVAAHNTAVQAASAATDAASVAHASCQFAALVVSAELSGDEFAWAQGYFGDGGPACDALRDILGNPFRPVTFDPSWASPDALSLARLIHTTRQFDDLPILADALEEAGCTDRSVLRHCREPGGHVCGCWVVAGVLRCAPSDS